MSARFPLIALAVVAVGGVSFEEYRIAQLKKQISTHQDRARDINGQLAQQKVEIEDLAKAKEILKAESNRLQKRLGEKGDTPDTPKPADKAAPGKEFMKGLAKMFSDPEMKKTMRGQQKMGMRMMYGELIKQLNLDPQKAEELLDILADRQLDLASAGMNALDKNNPDRKEQMARNEEKSRLYDEQLKAALGEDNFATMKEFEKSMGDRMMLQQFEGTFASSGAPLEPTQKDQLLQLMAAERAKMPAKLNLTNNTNASEQVEAIQSDESVAQIMNAQKDFQGRVLAGARQFLSPEQLQALEKVNKQQMEFMENQIKMSKQFLGLGK